MIETIEAMELKDLALFAGLPEDELQGIAQLTRRTTVPAGTILITAQVPGEAVYFILAGSVKVQLLRESGGELTLALLGPGDIVGEMSLITGHGRSAHVITREETQLLWLERRAFLRAMEGSPGLARNLIHELSNRLQIANERFQALGSLDVTGRVARQILELAERYGRTVPGEGIHIVFPVTQGEIAELIAATRERVNQIMVRLKRAGVFSVDADSRLTIHRPDVLAELCRV
jgi:CRP/FNR family cyclic AMP-dependent transcriptional regulator